MASPGTRDSILDAAARLYAEAGYDGVSMRDVAAAVGLGPAGLYHHFQDKEALIRQTLTWVFAARMERLEVLAAQPATPPERLRAMIGWFVQQLFDDPIFARLLCRELLDAPPERREYLTRVVFERPFALVTAVLAECSDRADPVLNALSVAGLMLGHYQMSAGIAFLPGGRPEHSRTDVLIRHITDLLDRALGLPDGALPTERTP